MHFLLNLASFFLTSPGDLFSHNVGGYLFGGISVLVPVGYLAVSPDD